MVRGAWLDLGTGEFLILKTEITGIQKDKGKRDGLGHGLHIANRPLDLELALS